MKKVIYLLLLFLISFGLVSCASMEKDANSNYEYGGVYPEEYFDNSYLRITEHSFMSVAEHPKSYFSLDTSTAGYSTIRRMINDGNINIPKDSIKIEEMVNYFSYDYEAPTEDTFNISGEIITAPWNSENKLVSIGVKAEEIDLSEKKPSNIVLLLDVSGSMSADNKLPLLQSAFNLFVETLDSNDVISIVTYANNSKVILEGARGFERAKIKAVIEDLEPKGGTAGGAGIQTAYEIAQKYFIEDGHNRVIIGTDGDFNVGITLQNGLKEFIEKKRDEELIYLSVLGFGYGNNNDATLETLANSGNGTYAYIDSITEARKVLVEEIGGLLNIVSNDTKVQVEFNPRFIRSYRLIGYENQLLSREEYLDDKTDAGEIGAGHTTTAIYEVVLNNDQTITSTMEENWLNVEITYKDPKNLEAAEVIKINNYLDDSSVLSKTNEDIIFISAVVEFGLILRDSDYKKDANLDNLIARIENLDIVKRDVYKAEFLALLKTYKGLLAN